MEDDLKSPDFVEVEDTGASEPLSIRDSLKAAMTVEPEEKGDDRPRDESGRFAPKQIEAPQQPKVDAVVTPEVTKAPVVTEPVVAPVEAIKPPPGWSPEAKADFAALPPHIQAAVTKREQEIDNGFKVLQDYKGLEQFSPYIKAANTTHAEVMKKALDYEAALQRDPVNTVLHVARIAGVDIMRLAAHLQQNPQPQQQMQQPQQPRINVEETVEQVLRKRDVENQIQSFLSDPANVHAEAVMEDMAALIKTGRAASIKDAYDAACWMRPDIRSQLINQAAPSPAPQVPKVNPADQARKAAKSITGSSAPGPSRDAGNGQPSSIRDSLKQAMSMTGTRA